jgi:hypothetical protein
MAVLKMQQLRGADGRQRELFKILERERSYRVEPTQWWVKGVFVSDAAQRMNQAQV